MKTFVSFFVCWITAEGLSTHDPLTFFSSICFLQVVIYGDGTSTPLTLRDWALVDYDHIWQQAVSYSVPHCIAETYNQLIERVKE